MIFNLRPERELDQCKRFTSRLLSRLLMRIARMEMLLKITLIFLMLLKMLMETDRGVFYLRIALLIGWTRSWFKQIELELIRCKTWERKKILSKLKTTNPLITTCQLLVNLRTFSRWNFPSKKSSIAWTNLSPFKWNRFLFQVINFRPKTTM